MTRIVGFLNGKEEGICYELKLNRSGDRVTAYRCVEGKRVATLLTFDRDGTIRDPNAQLRSAIVLGQLFLDRKPNHLGPALWRWRKKDGVVEPIDEANIFKAELVVVRMLFEGHTLATSKES